jgi:hypothetical protein
MKDRWFALWRRERPLPNPNEQLLVYSYQIGRPRGASSPVTSRLRRTPHARFYAIPATAAAIQHIARLISPFPPFINPPFHRPSKIRRGPAAHLCAVAKTRGAGAELPPSTGRATAELKTRGNIAAVQKRALVGPPCSACCELNSPSDPDPADLFTATATATAVAGRSMMRPIPRRQTEAVQWGNPQPARPLHTNTPNGAYLDITAGSRPATGQQIIRDSTRGGLISPSHRGPAGLFFGTGSSARHNWTVQYISCM